MRCVVERNQDAVVAAQVKLGDGGVVVTELASVLEVNAEKKAERNFDHAGVRDPDHG